MSDLHSTVDDSLPLSVVERVDGICDQFENAWLAGQRPQIEDFLAEISDERMREVLVKELIALEIYHRQKLGETILPRDYQRFSPLAADTLIDASVSRAAAPEWYRMGEKIGVGGMGEVHRGRDLRLNRELAIKVLRPEHQGHAHMQQRFLEEAQIGGRLQHPGIVPVHDLGELSDGRPFFTMKLVEGRTLAALLAERAEPSQDLPHFLTIFEQICQTLAYAHTQGVIHRDLKPANVMVGAFGEVQVMDWGLAKVLKRSSVGEARAGAETVVYSAVEEDASWQMRTQPGQAMGTYAYMPPEQARGEIERVDERSDVFGLGAILCEILIGRSPFTGRDKSEIFAKAEACDHAEAMARLESCGADADLLQLAKACLAAKPEDRPRNAGAVAESVKSYLAGVQERLRAAERERAAAQARAEEAEKTAAAEQARAEEEKKRAAAERQAHRRMVWAALAMLLLIVGAGGGAWWQQRKQEQADGAVEQGLAQAELLAKEAREVPLEVSKYRQALEAARVAADLAKGASHAVRGKADELVARLQREKAAAERDRRLLAALLEVHNPLGLPKFKPDDKGMMTEVPEPTVEEQFAAAFLAWGLDVDVAPTAEAAELLKARPAAVVTEVIAALDEWASQRQRDRKRKAAGRVAELAVALDDDPSSLRRELREVLARGRLPIERALGVLSASLRPVPVPVEVPLGKDRTRLRQLAEKIDPSAEPVLGLLTLTRALRVDGEEALAEQLLRAALTARPQEVVIYRALGQLLIEQEPPRWAEAVECYQATRALRPGLGAGLALALTNSGRAREALDQIDRMVHESPDNPILHIGRGHALEKQRRYVEAEAAICKAIDLKPDDAAAFVNLGFALECQRKHVDAEAAYRKAIALKPNYAEAYMNLAVSLEEQGKYVEAEAACRSAIAFEPDLATAYCNLGTPLNRQGRYAEAEAACRKAIALKPNHAPAYCNLGTALNRQGRYAEAEAACRKAIALEADFATAYGNLGLSLAGQGRYAESEAACRKVIALEADSAAAYNNLGNALDHQKQHSEAEAAYRKAIALKPDQPDLAITYSNLGTALNSQGRHAEAEAAYRKAIALKPDYAEAYHNLGKALHDQKKHAVAEAAYRMAIALKPDQPDLAITYSNLGTALNSQGRHAEAEAAYRKAIALKPDYAEAYHNLGNALQDQEKRAEAEVAYRKVIELDPDAAEAYCSLGIALRSQGRFKESLAAFRRGHELGAKRSGWRYPSLQWVRKAEQLVELEKKPANVQDLMTVARMATHQHQQFLVTVRFLEQSLAANPDWAGRLPADPPRYYAACCAAMAAAGKDRSAGILEAAAQRRLRQQAVSWLRDELDRNRKRLAKGTPEDRAAVAKALAYWKVDGWLAAVRDKDAVDKLPQDERDACRKLWADVATLHKRSQEK
jgi:serine/threonine-protein kinase